MLAIGALLLLCAVRGAWFTAGLTVPPDEDITRDIGFIQGMLDGNWFSDPIHGGAWRWYPPLFHAIGAAVAKVSGVDLLPAWVLVGAWLNLATPLCFFLMCTRLIGWWPAVAATATLTVFDAAVMSGDEVASYTPMTLTPALAWPLFFLGVWCIVSWAPRLRWRDAALVGAILGLAFLGHTVPAILLSAITAAVVFAEHGLQRRALMWLTAVASLEFAFGAVFLLPLLINYRLHIANPVPGAWVHNLLKPQSLGRLLLLNLPGLLALPLLAALRRPAAAALAAWIGVCAVFLLRHYICTSIGGGGACTVLQIAPHHFHVYLQAAWACLIGLALWRLLQRLPSQVAAALGAAAVLACCIGLFGLSRDSARREAALLRPDAVLDRAMYRWILRETTPHDLFVTPLPEAPDQMGATVATVFAAGRRMVAPPELHSNPYLQWAPMNARRLDYLSGSAAALCRFAAEAGPRATAWFLLPNDQPAPPAPRVFSSAQHTLYRVDATQCDSAAP